MSEPAVMEMLSGEPVLVVVFGGVRQGIGIDMPPFEFLRSMAGQKCDAFFLRDLKQAWYQLGLDGVAADVLGVARWLESRRRNYKRAIALGNSMGGYAALLYGRLAGFDLSIAFNPQTTIDASDRKALGDKRWEGLIRRIQPSCADQLRHMDILSAPATQPAEDRLELVFFGTDSPEDVAHAARLANEPSCHLFAVKGTDHRAVKALRDSGVLGRLIRLACNPTARLSAILDDLRSDINVSAVHADRGSSMRTKLREA